MADTTIVITGGSFAAAYCPASWQQLLNDIVARLSGYIPNGIKGVVISDTVPVAEDQDKLWIKTSGGAPIGWFIFYNGSWVRPHETPPSGQERRLWVGSTADLITYDGGAAGTVGAATGPMWEVDTDFAAKFLVGVGTLPNGTAVPVGGTGGDDEITLSAANIPEHRHFIGVEGSGIADPGPAETGYLRVGLNEEVSFITTGNPPQQSVGRTRLAGGSAAADVEAIETLPPYRGLYLIKRSARIYFLA